MTTIQNKPGKLSVPMTASEKGGMMLPGVNEIGRGVDVINKPFATVDSLLSRLFQIEDRLYPSDTDAGEIANAYASCERLFGRETWGFADVEPIIGGQTKVHKWEGETLTSIQSKVMESADVQGSYSGFSGQAQAMSETNSGTSASAYFCNYFGSYPIYRLRLKPRESLRSLLKPDVRDALDTWPAEKLISDFFPTYGGYYLKNAIIGGLVNYACVRNAHSTMSDSDFAAAMNASYEYGITSASGSASASEKEAHEHFVSGCDVIMYSQGGDRERQIIFADPKSFRRWQNGIKDAPELIAFENLSDGAGCAPVWELAEAPRQELIRDAFLEYAEKQQTVLAFYDPDLKPLYGFADWNSFGLKRWLYSTDDDYPKSKAWERKHKHIHVYESPRPGCAKFTCCKKKMEKKNGLFKKNDDLYYHKIVEGDGEKGWKSFCTFYAPKKPLKASLDAWTPIHRYKRNTNGEYCGEHFKEGNVVGGWSLEDKNVFCAVVK